MNNKLLKITLLFLFSSGITWGQTGVNTDTPTVTLDIAGETNGGGIRSTDGLLTPRVNALSASGSQDGQLVYLIADAGGFTKGFHYWDGSAWTPFTSSGGSQDTFYTADGTLTENRTVDLNNSRTLSFDTNSLVIDAANNKVTVATAFQYQDGNQSNGRVLTSDANGNATWADAPTGGSGGGAIDNYTIVSATTYTMTSASNAYFFINSGNYTLPRCGVDVPLGTVILTRGHQDSYSNFSTVGTDRIFSVIATYLTSFYYSISNVHNHFVCVGGPFTGDYGTPPGNVWMHSSV